VNQALNYANQNGKRWVVLTNGRAWRLYDNTICAAAKEKLVAEASIQDTASATRFLTAISRPSVMEDGLPRFSREERERLKAATRRGALVRILESALADESSPLVIAMLAALKGQEDLAELTAEDLVAHFAGRAPEPPIGPLPPQAPSEEVLIVPARFAWGEYRTLSVYMCQPNRFFRPTSHLGFYADGAIQAAVPKIVDVVQSVEFSEKGVARCPDISEGTRTRLLELIRALQRGDSHGRVGKPHKVMFLTAPDSPETIHLAHPIRNDKVTRSGRPWAFVVGQGYVSLARLMTCPETTSQLVQE
jgi:hypothetical protein